jgi:hypothetical protein
MKLATASFRNNPVEEGIWNFLYSTLALASVEIYHQEAVWISIRLIKSILQR